MDSDGRNDHGRWGVYALQHWNRKLHSTFRGGGLHQYFRIFTDCGFFAYGYRHRSFSCGDSILRYYRTDFNLLGNGIRNRRLQ